MKWRNLLSLTLLSVAMMWVLSSCEESGTITPTTPTTSDDVTLSGSMSLSAPAASAAKQANKLYVVAPTDYKLYCVTFTNPPIAGEGNFDASGNFTVTLADAAGLAIGCFINEIATNKTVSTLTFDTGDTTNLSGGTTNTSTAMKSGTHTISINFDPATGTATADVTQAVDTTVVATITPADIAGNWLLNCASATEGNTAEEVALCNDFLGSMGGSLPVYANVLEGTMGTETVYALAPWSSKAAFDACGSTDALVNLTGVTNVTSTSGLTTLTPFNGLMSDTRYKTATHSIVASDLYDFMVSKGWTSMPLMWGGGDNYCQTRFSDITTAPFTLSGTSMDAVDSRVCLLGSFEANANANPAECLPRIKSTNWYDFAMNGDATNDISFETALGGASVQLAAEDSRYDLMPMEILADSAVATSFGSYQYQQWDDVNNVAIDCAGNHEMTLTITPDATGGTAFGRFTTKESDSCDPSRDSYGSFFTTWVKQP